MKPNHVYSQAHYRTKPHYVYRCYDVDGRLVYVGCTIDPATRVETHRKQSWWGHQIHSVRFIVFPNKDYALTREREAIGEERPRWNKKGKWNHRALWTAQDYADYHTTIVMSGGAETHWNSGHLKRVIAEAKQRYGIDLEAVA